MTTRIWKAHWIDVPGASTQEYGVYHFRRSFDLQNSPGRFVVYVSGDNRYQLYANGHLVSWGPARGDLTHWRYETVDIGPQLHAGRNVLAAVVSNDGQQRAIAQISNQTGFLLEAERGEDVFVNTNSSWRSIQDKAYSPQMLPADQKTGYYALGPNEKVAAAAYPWGWAAMDFDDGAWLPAREITPAASRDSRDAPNRWMLVAREIPMEELKREGPLKCRKPDGCSLPVMIPAHTSTSILLDQTYLTTAYPELTVSRGQGATINLRYAEALYVRRHPDAKGNRNDIEGLQFYGPFDSYVLDGGSHRVFRPLYWRTYRYVRVEVTTADEPVQVESLDGTFTGYPFEQRAKFQCLPDRDAKAIWATGWRTARLCAHETYMDCPFYEQLQYAGDARIQMLISLFMSGDARLMRNGIDLLDSSRTAEGATYSRAPSNLQQYIPPFSLWWIGMLHDYWWYVDDADFVRSMLPGMRAVLSFFRVHQKPDGSLGQMPWWNFVDWVHEWKNGEPPPDADGTSAAALDLQLLLAYQWAADLENALGDKALSEEDTAAAQQLSDTIGKTDWDDGRQLFADQPSHRTYSQQVNTLAVLAHVITGEQARAVIEKTIGDGSLAQCSIYFRAYLNATLREVGLGDRYLEMLRPWREMLQQGLTTWSEWNGPDTRSDCHAWGASPNYELLRTVAGIDSTAPGFSKVRVAPNMGMLDDIEASMPHPKGMISVALKQSGDHISGTVELPAGVTGSFEWQGHSHSLQSGVNKVSY
ncbi:MAG: family 78 glycoside hydrolase catalytic domain [Acidobacteriaceae bacterium]|nr:family 78 glycoside hydrolase catalytic domain [Acidobacteriaceae bacterium]